MENNNGNNGQHNHDGVCNHCGCGGNYGGRHMRHGVLRVVLGLIIVYMVFSLGLKIGALENEVGGNSYPHQMMYRY